MSIRVKLLLTYLIMVIISAVILIFSGIAIVTSVFNDTAEAVITENNYHVTFVDAIDLLAELKQAEDYEPEKLSDPDFIKDLSTRDDFYRGGLVVKYDDQFICYDDLPNTADFFNFVESTSINSEMGSGQVEDKMHHKFDNKSYFVIKHSFKFNEETIEYFFVVDTSRTRTIGSKAGRKAMTTLGIILFIILTPLALIITYDIIKPIKKLEYG